MACSRVRSWVARHACGAWPRKVARSAWPSNVRPREMTMLRHTLACLLAVAATCAQAAMGVTRVTPLEGDGPVTVYYPTAAAEVPVQRGPFKLSIAVNAPPVKGNGHLVVISHGSGGNPWVHSDLARALVDAGFVVAMPQH